MSLFIESFVNGSCFKKNLRLFTSSPLDLMVSLVNPNSFLLKAEEGVVKGEPSNPLCIAVFDKTQTIEVLI